MADRADAIWKAVEAAWPNAIRFNCSWHLGQNLISAAQRDGVYHSESQFPDLIKVAFRSVPQWETLYDLAQDEQRGNIMKWMEVENSLVRHQIELRAAHPDYPRSNMAAEAPLRTVDDHIGPRRLNFRNATRFATILDLMTAYERGLADPAAYARIVRETVAQAVPDLDAGMDHGALMTPATATALPSIAKMLLRASEARATKLRGYNLTAKAKSVLATAEAFNVERRRLGMPLIEVYLTAGGSPGVSARGKLLTDFPEFAQEWDTAANGRGPDGIKAGSGAQEWQWRCIRGHEWPARVSDRINRLLRCKRCATERGDPATVLATVHPEMISAFHLEANRPLSPYAIRRPTPSASGGIVRKARSTRPTEHPSLAAARLRSRASTAGTCARSRTRRGFGRHRPSWIWATPTRMCSDRLGKRPRPAPRSGMRLRDYVTKATKVRPSATRRVRRR